MSRFRILSLDGGVRGAFSASALAALEEETGQALVEHFDLITGTSTGGITALGLAMGLPASELRDFFRDKGLEVFPGTGIVERMRDKFQHGVSPKRNHEALEAALRSIFKNLRLGEARCRVVLPTYDAVAGRIYLLKTAHHERFIGEYQSSVVECALATSTAPNYFAATAFAAYPGSSYIDGGMWANCPVMVGITEAVHVLGVPLEQIDVLSLGLMGAPFSVSPDRSRSGPLGWASTLIESLIRGQSEAALGQARLLTGHNLHRIDQVISRDRLSLDDERVIDDLIQLGDGEARKDEHLSEVKRRFLNGQPATPFVPAHRL